MPAFIYLWGVTYFSKKPLSFNFVQNRNVVQLGPLIFSSIAKLGTHLKFCLIIWCFF